VTLGRAKNREQGLKFCVGTRAGPAVFQPVPPVGWIGGDVEMERAASSRESWGIDSEIAEKVGEGGALNQLGEQVARAAARLRGRSVEAPGAS
jgi:hypothetical protein